MTTIKCILCYPNDQVPLYVNVNFDLIVDNHDDTPSKLLQGSPTIVGARPENDLLLLGIDQTTLNLPLNSFPLFDSFNKDDELRGNILIIKTNEDGDPIDIDI
tara:strand:- start:252 stop:560 length:309 start_codon:yes stop_codon:yes gene_type:complete